MSDTPENPFFSTPENTRARREMEQWHDEEHEGGAKGLQTSEIFSSNCSKKNCGSIVYDSKTPGPTLRGSEPIDVSFRGWTTSPILVPLPAVLIGSRMQSESPWLGTEPGCPNSPPLINSLDTPVTISDSNSLTDTFRRRHLLNVNAVRSHFSAILEARFFLTTYRIFFLTIITANMLGIALAAAGWFPYAREHTGNFILGNLFVAVLMRNELFLRILYAASNLLLAKWPPLSVRLAVTSALQHIGGVHSGCATSGFLWITFKVVAIFRARDSNAISVLVFGLLTNLAIGISVISALPWIRNQYHNTFERQHRFVGWMGIMFTWIFVILGNCYNPSKRKFEPSARHLFGDQQFWYILGMTILVIIPWAVTRQVDVSVEVPAKNKMAVLRFERGMQQGLLGRVARNGVLEYHAFGIVSEGVHAQYHYMVCGVQGDFTRGLVENPPTRLWTREIKFAGVSNTSKLYRRGIRICTGTGIGAGLSTCLQDENWFLIWIGSDLVGTFGQTIYSLVTEKIPPSRRVLWDSKKLGGRPDTMSLLEETYRAWNAEVVFITSNDQGNREMMLGCSALGIPAFGTLFDF